MMDVGNYSGVSWVLNCESLSEKRVKINEIKFKLIRWSSGWGRVINICCDCLFIIVLFVRLGC